MSAQPSAGSVLGVGVTHYPGLLRPDAKMAMPLQRMLSDPAIPEREKDPANWPDAMVREWADDQGAAAAGEHRQRCFAGFSKVRAAMDDFAPDVVLIVGDDQYENFREDIIPPFCVQAYDDMDVQPWHDDAAGNPWGEGVDFRFHVPGDRSLAKDLVEGLLERNVDMAYAYRPLHEPGLSHSILNTLLLLDHERKGFPYPVVPVLVNCYGRRVIANKGGFVGFGELGPTELDPPGPAPARCFDVGRALSGAASAVGKRVAVVASSSWSHGFLTDKHWRLRPDVEADRALYHALETGDYEAFARPTLDELEAAGQQEVLNWSVLMGVAAEHDLKPAHTELVESYVFNSSKCFAVLA